MAFLPYQQVSTLFTSEFDSFDRMKRHRFSVFLLLLLRLAPASTSEVEEECTIGTDGEQVVCVSRINNKNANDATAATATSSSPNRNVVVADSTAATDNEEVEDCRDQHEQCDFWASAGECKNNPKYMLYNCPVSCQSCNIDKAAEAEAYRELADQTELYGDRQAIPNQLVANRTREVITYMTDTVFVNASYAKVKDEVGMVTGVCGGASWSEQAVHRGDGVVVKDDFAWKNDELSKNISHLVLRPHTVQEPARTVHSMGSGW